MLFEYDCQWFMKTETFLQIDFAEFWQFNSKQHLWSKTFNFWSKTLSAKCTAKPIDHYYLLQAWVQCTSIDLARESTWELALRIGIIRERLTTPTSPMTPSCMAADDGLILWKLINTEKFNPFSRKPIFLQQPPVYKLDFFERKYISNLNAKFNILKLFCSV